ncbi:MAG: hypothetical protein LBQ14_04185 [Treponema sp.]|nr:hypothetical protein [Treponema sp.]
MRNNRKAALFLTDNQLPVYEGDIVKVLIAKDGRTNIYWHPRSCDFKTPDITRLRGKSKYLRLGQNEYAVLESAQRLTIVLEPADTIYIYRVTPERRHPLLRFSVRGLPPRWV